MSGDSAGGGLTYAIAQYLRDKQTELPMPAGLAPLTPWIDSEFFRDGMSVRTKIWPNDSLRSNPQ